MDIICRGISDQRIAKIVASHGLDQILSEAILKEIELVEYKAGEGVIIEGTQMQYYYFFIEGRLKIYQTYENGKSFLIQFYTKMDSLGEVEIMENAEAFCSIDAVVDALLLRIPLSDMKNLMRTHLPFAQYIAKSLSRKLTSANHNQAFNLLYPVKNRLASYLIWHCEDFKTVAYVDNNQEISAFLGTSYRQFCRAINALENEGYIEKDGKQIHIKKYDDLRRLAGHIYVEGQY